jgi:cytochrome c
MGAVPDYSSSRAVREKGGVWSDRDLAAYLRNPKAYIPGQKMILLPIKDLRRIADIVVYLRQLSDTQRPQRN